MLESMRRKRLLAGIGGGSVAVAISASGDDEDDRDGAGLGKGSEGKGLIQSSKALTVSAPSSSSQQLGNENTKALSAFLQTYLRCNPESCGILIADDIGSTITSEGAILPTLDATRFALSLDLDVHLQYGPCQSMLLFKKEGKVFLTRVGGLILVVYGERDCDGEQLMSLPEGLIRMVENMSDLWARYHSDMEKHGYEPSAGAF